MNWQTQRRADFHASGPFMAKKDGAVGDLTFAYGKIFSADELEAGGVHALLRRRLYDTYWMDMAPAPEPSIEDDLATAFNGGSSPQRATGEGSAGAAGGAAAGEPASIPPAEPAQGGNGPAGAPVTPEPAKGPEKAPVAAQRDGYAPEGAAATGVKSFGYGKFWRIDAAGLKIGTAMKQAEAKQVAAVMGVDVLPQKAT